MRLIWIILMCLGCAIPHHRRNSKKRKWIHTFGLSWVGILSYKETAKSKEAIAGIILIDNNLAIVNAHEVAFIDKEHIRKTTKVMVLTKNGKVRTFAVVDYILHPEFDELTLSTIAVLQLENNRTKIEWEQLIWPKDDSRMNKHKGRLYTVGFTDRYQALEQVKYKMEYVNFDHCQWFYHNEKVVPYKYCRDMMMNFGVTEGNTSTNDSKPFLNNKWMAPIQYQCFRRKDFSEKCTFDSGMALVSLFRGKWTLLGMSVLGPGCALPSRFIDFSRYMPWIRLSTKKARRMILESQINWPNYDKLLLQKINDTSLVLRPYHHGEQVIYGNCELKKGESMYSESGKFEVPNYGLGLYALSVWDDNYMNISCVTLDVDCEKISDKPFSFNYGLVQYSDDLGSMYKSIPISNFNESVGPKILHTNQPWLEWWFRPKKTKVASVVFKFQFYKEAILKIKFFGTPWPHPELDEGVFRPTQADNVTRSRRRHRTFTRAKLRWGGKT